LNIERSPKKAKSYGLARSFSGAFCLGLGTGMRKAPVTAKMLQKFLRRLIAARQNGSNGGYVRAGRYSSEKLSEWAAKGGEAVLTKHGPDYFVELRKRRKNYPKQNEPYAVFQDSPRVVAGRQNGQRGGFARAGRHGLERRKEWARLGGTATRARYGNDYYREIRKLRRYYPKGYLAREMEERLRHMIVDRRCGDVHG
jgi:hypothetical protein